MSQTYYDDVYSGGQVVQTSMQRIEDNFAAIKSCFSGTAAPASPAGGMLWIDTTNHLLMQRNEANTAWITRWDMTKTTWLAMLLANLGAALDGDRGDITVSGSGLVWTISAESISVSMMAEYAAGNYPIYMSESEASTESTSYVALTGKKIYLSRGGVVRVKFQGKGYTGDVAYARVYINGVAQGTRQDLSSTYNTFTEDFNVSAKDYIEVRAKGGEADPTTIRYFGIYTASLEQTCAGV